MDTGFIVVKCYRKDDRSLASQKKIKIPWQSLRPNGCNTKI